MSIKYTRSVLARGGPLDGHLVIAEAVDAVAWQDGAYFVDADGRTATWTTYAELPNGTEVWGIVAFTEEHTPDA